MFTYCLHKIKYVSLALAVQCTVYSVQCTVYNVQCTIYSVQCTVYSTVFMMFIVSGLQVVESDEKDHVLIVQDSKVSKRWISSPLFH